MASNAQQAVRVLAWNIENLGGKKVNLGASQLIDFLAGVLTHNTIDIAAFCEMRLFADRVGDDLTKKLPGWDYIATKAFVPGRWEEYLILWNRATVANVPLSTDKYLSEFKDPGLNTKLGFPRQTKDRPPVVAEFRPLKGTSNLRIGMIHAPEPGYAPGPREAAKNLAKVVELREKKKAGLLMGDFNVKKFASIKNKTSFGFAAFSDLGKVGLTQLLHDDKTSLGSRRKAIKISSDCTSSPYDQLFFWPGGAGTSAVATSADAKVVDVVSDVLKSSTLKQLLVKLYKNKVSITNISTAAEAFLAYRNMVSDHYPVSVTVNC
jgi:hypothetical protein